jgi:hypothetical protein
LFVTHPRLAADLGIVDRVEWVPTLRESAYVGQGNAEGLYDYGSAVKFPWNITASSYLEGWSGTGSRLNGADQITDPGYLANKAYYYGDTNKNDRYRVRALIEGLTDVPSYMIGDAIFQVDFDPWGWNIVAYKYLHRDSGLQIGDEYIFWGTDMGMWKFAESDERRFGRIYGTWATPNGHVKAGTVVTTFGAKHWLGKNEVDNPYKDYATTIVLRPGDPLNGKPIKGKIYVNFTEQPNFQPEAVAVQKLPANNADFPANYNPDTAAQREWEWSGTRKSLRTQGQTTQTSTNVALPDGTVVTVTGVKSDSLPFTRSTNLFPIEWHLSWQMNRRGLYWLGDRPTIDPGSVGIAEAPLAATAAMPTATVVAEKDADVAAQPMSALTYMPKVAEDKDGNTQVVTLPMTAHAEFSGFSRVISAAPMTADAVLVENFAMVRATGEQVVLILHGVDATLYLKEEE